MPLIPSVGAPSSSKIVPAAQSLPLEQAVALLSGESSWLTKRVPGVGQAFVADGPHGLRAIAGANSGLSVIGALPATCFPTAVTMASTWDPDLIRKVGEALGKEARALGVDVILGPGMNIKRHPLCGRNFEYFSEDPYLSGIIATAITNGIQSQGVGTSVKHFAVNNQETNRFVVDAEVGQRTLRELYLKGFEMVVRAAQPWTVMAAYNLVNGTHATENRELLADILRNEWGFEGLVMSDWGAVADRVAGVKAGLDLEMPGSKGLWDAEVLKAVANGALPRDAVDKCAQRVIELVDRAPKLNPRKRAVSEKLLAQNNQLAKEVAISGSVLLMNDGVLPLPPKARIAVIGEFADKPRYQGFGSSLVNAAKVTTSLDALRDRGIQLEYVRGYDALESPDDAAALTEAIVAARKADVAVVFAGLPPVIESESFDRDNLLLPAQHDALITAVAAANPNTVVVLFNGAPVLMPWLGSVRAVLDVYLGGQAGGAAIADMLYGEAEPGGRLAETFPRSLADVPANANFPGSPHQVVYAEGQMVGYRHNTTNGVAPLFPFGFGLGYTTFRWTNAQASAEHVTINALPDGAATLAPACEVSVTVANTGARRGSDVVQVYLSDRTGAVERPRRELAAFAKVELAPGESRRVTIPVPRSAFAYWDTRLGWQVPSGQFDLEVARNSQDIVAALPIDVSGTTTGSPGVRETNAWGGATAQKPSLSSNIITTTPPERPVRPFTRDSTLGELEQTFVGRRVAAMVRKQALPADADPLTRLMVTRQLAEMPIRSAAMFSNGKFTMKMVDGILAAANGNAAKLLPALRQRNRVTSARA